MPKESPIALETIRIDVRLCTCSCDIENIAKNGITRLQVKLCKELRNLRGCLHTTATTGEASMILIIVHLPFGKGKKFPCHLEKL